MKNTIPQSSVVFPTHTDIPESFQMNAALEQKSYLINGEMRAWHGAFQDVYSPIYIQNEKELTPQRLGSFTIFLDKPFVIGDLIRVGNVEGNVEKIGFRSTRIRTLEKTFVTVPNKKLVDTELDNLTNREIRRIKFDLALRYDTPIASIQNIINDTRAMIENDTLRFDEVSVTFMNSKTVHLLCA